MTEQNASLKNGKKKEKRKKKEMIEFTLAWAFQFVYLGEMDSSTPRRLAETSGKIP